MKFINPKFYFFIICFFVAIVTEFSDYLYSLFDIKNIIGKVIFKTTVIIFVCIVFGSFIKDQDSK